VAVFGVTLDTTAAIALVFAAIATGVAVTQSQRARRAETTVVTLQRELAAVEAKRASLDKDRVAERAGPTLQRSEQEASATASRPSRLPHPVFASETSCLLTLNCVRSFLRERPCLRR
jgi:hypothetical protein